MGGREILFLLLRACCDAVIYSVQLHKFTLFQSLHCLFSFSKLLLYAKHHQCNACHLTNEHELLLFFLSYGHTTLIIVCFFCLLFIIRRISQQVFKPDRGDLLKENCV